MAEQLVNEFTVNRPIAEAWSVITDVERIAPCLPGAQLQEIAQGEGGAPDVFRGVVKIKLGSITPSFKGQASFVDRDDAAYRAVLKAEGRDTGGRGNAAAEITAQAESLSPTSTKVTVTTDLHITGKVAQFGRGIIGDVSKKLMAQFAGNLNTMLDDDGTASANGHTPGTDDQSAQDDAPAAASEVSSSVSSSTSTSDDAEPATEPETAPRVRKIDSPATEPVDLAGVAGPAVLKRLAPALAALLVLLLLLRKRK